MVTCDGWPQTGGFQSHLTSALESEVSVKRTKTGVVIGLLGRGPKLLSLAYNRGNVQPGAEYAPHQLSIEYQGTLCNNIAYQGVLVLT